jgi:uncharacterized protein (DUF305 family)
MQRTAFAVLWASAVAAPLVVAIPIIAGAQSAAPQPAPARSAWFAQHQAFAQIRMDEAALAMGRSAEQIAKNEAVKKLAADVVAGRTKDLDADRAAYAKQYGSATPAPWSGPGGGYGPGMMGGYGPGAQGQGQYGPMMGGAGAHPMMGGQGGSWSSNPDRGFPAALIRLDAMDIARVSIALQTSDASSDARANAIIDQRLAEIARAKALLR